MRGFILILLMAIAAPLAAQLRTITADGNWATTGIWTGGNVAMTVAEDVDMNNTVSVSITNGQTFNVGSINANNNNIITINAGGSLTLGDPGNPKVFTGGNNTTITVAGNLVIYGDLTVNNNLTITVTGAGSITVIGDVLLNNNGALVVNGTLSVQGDFTGGNNTNVNVNGTIDVGGLTTMGANSTLSGIGHFNAHGGCIDPGTFCLSPGTLPLKLVSFTARAEQRNVAVRWTTEEETGVDFFTIQRSADGKEFTDLGDVRASSEIHDRHNYLYHDTRPLQGFSYYRLKETDTNGASTFFKIARVDFNAAPFVATFYPNPVVNGILNLESALDPASGFTVVISDSAGKVVHNIESHESQLSIPMNVSPGLYIVHLTSPGYHSVSKIMVR